MTISHLHLSVNKVIKFYWWEIKGNLVCLNLGVGNTRRNSQGNQRMEPTFTERVPFTLCAKYRFHGVKPVPDIRGHLVPTLGTCACSFHPHSSPFISIFTGEETER
ncbi:unnamed protein product [Rangifer tarandus platyrhynchus]|uniref:Uncharacterized protein n=2 Tax=Rangifer tarandus platyrhynchus TaxID=3082113 RepID=A0ABN8YN89_RANTA|nr:unnamed protein product [Rangifer tarandus platyrhynchus]